MLEYMPWQAWLGWLVWAIALASVAISILVNSELVDLMKRREPALYERLGRPSYLGYEWRFWPRKPRYTRWLKEQREGTYKLFVRRLRACRAVFWTCLLIAFAAMIWRH